MCQRDVLLQSQVNCVTAFRTIILTEKSSVTRQCYRIQRYEYLPAFSRETLVAAVQDVFMNLTTRARYAPLRLWTLERRQAAWRKAGLSREAEKTIGKRFNALLAMYWTLTHVKELQRQFGLDSTAGAKHLEAAGGNMISTSGKSRFESVSEHATGVVRARATTAL